VIELLTFDCIHLDQLLWKLFFFGKLFSLALADHQGIFKQDQVQNQEQGKL
jgi:hypothetical protein